VFIQAKRYKVDLSVSEPKIRAFSGSLGTAKANKGVFVSTSSFSRASLLNLPNGIPAKWF
jgi:restriction system protein